MNSVPFDTHVITDDALVVTMLRRLAPAYLDEMIRLGDRQLEIGARSTIIMRDIYSRGLKRGLVVLYFGWGCENPKGWQLIEFSALDEVEHRLRVAAIHEVIASTFSARDVAGNVPTANN